MSYPSLPTCSHHALKKWESVRASTKPVISYSLLLWETVHNPTYTDDQLYLSGRYSNTGNGAQPKVSGVRLARTIDGINEIVEPRIGSLSSNIDEMSMNVSSSVAFTSRHSVLQSLVDRLTIEQTSSPQVSRAQSPPQTIAISITDVDDMPTVSDSIESLKPKNDTENVPIDAADGKAAMPPASLAHLEVNKEIKAREEARRSWESFGNSLKPLNLADSSTPRGVTAPSKMSRSKSISIIKGNDRNEEVDVIGLNIVYDTKDGVEKVIDACTLSRLVYHMTDTYALNTKLHRMLLLTCDTYTTPLTLLCRLIERYNTIVDEQTSEVTRRTVTRAVCEIISLWVTEFWDMHYKDALMVSTLSEFCDSKLAQSSVSNSAQQLRTALAAAKNRASNNQSVSSSLSARVSTPPPKVLPKYPSNVTILQIPPEDIAKQLTLIDGDLFKAIIAKSELLSQGWAVQSRAYLCPNVVAMIKRFSMISAWVIVNVMTNEPGARPSSRSREGSGQLDGISDRTPILDAKYRARLYTYYVTVAEQLRSLNNFHSMMAVLAGLKNASLMRLEETLKEVPKRSIASLDSLLQLMSFTGSYRSYRNALEQSMPPVVPYLGVITQDLTSVYENADVTSSGLINISKRRLLYDVISKVESFQTYTYRFLNNDSLARFLLMPQFDMDHFMSLSNQCETSSY